MWGHDSSKARWWSGGWLRGKDSWLLVLVLKSYKYQWHVFLSMICIATYSLVLCTMMIPIWKRFGPFWGQKLRRIFSAKNWAWNGLSWPHVGLMLGVHWAILSLFWVIWKRFGPFWGQKHRAKKSAIFSAKKLGLKRPILASCWAMLGSCACRFPCNQSQGWASDNLEPCLPREIAQSRITIYDL